MTTKKLTRQDHERYANQMLKKAKPDVRALVMDQDGTVKGGNDPRYQKANVAELLQKIAKAGKYPAIITASGASALKSFAGLVDFYALERISFPAFIGIGNGSALYRFDISGRRELYNHGLTLDEAKAIVDVWEKTYQELGIKETDLQPKGIQTFQDFARADWSGYIPSEYVDFFRHYQGRCFTEQIKVTVVFPAREEEKQRILVAKMQQALDQTLGSKRYLASRGDDTFLHITHTFEIDPKLFALRTIMKSLKLTEKQIVAIGDMPLDNDRGLLVESRLPFTFANSFFKKRALQELPFILPGSSESGIASVYLAIDYLLS